MTDTRTDFRLTVNDTVRFMLKMFAIVSLTLWAFLARHFPLNIVIGIGAPVLAIALWALFGFPKAVIPIDPSGRALVEIVVMASAAFAWWDLRQPVVALVFAAVATISGFINARREFR